MAALIANGHAFANIDSANLRGESILGSYLLAIEFQISVNPLHDSKERLLTDFCADLFVERVGRINEFVGTMFPRYRPIVITASKNVYRTQETLTLEIDHRKIALLEEVRNGKGIVFQLRFRGLVSQDGLLRRCDGDMSLAIEHSKWVDVLRVMNFTNILLLEIPLSPQSIKSSLLDAFAFFAEAHNDFLQARWIDVVAKCRKCLESVPRKVVPKYPDKKDKPKWVRIDDLQSAVMNITHLASHFGDEVSRQASWTRQDAELLICCISALLRKLNLNEE